LKYSLIPVVVLVAFLLGIGVGLLVGKMAFSEQPSQSNEQAKSKETGDSGKGEKQKGPAGSQSPSASLKATLDAANAGRYSEANEVIAPQMLEQINKAGWVQMHQFWDHVTKKGTIAKVKIQKEKIRGEGATIEYTIHYEDGSSHKLSGDLIKENGKWQLTTTAFFQLMTTIKKGPREKKKETKKDD
jgi:hypothetical protein